jgi:hypothetical protein
MVAIITKPPWLASVASTLSDLLSGAGYFESASITIDGIYACTQSFNSEMILWQVWPLGK